MCIWLDLGKAGATASGQKARARWCYSGRCISHVLSVHPRFLAAAAAAASAAAAAAAAADLSDVSRNLFKSGRARGASASGGGSGGRTGGLLSAERRSEAPRARPHASDTTPGGTEQPVL